MDQVVDKEGSKIIIFCETKKNCDALTKVSQPCHVFPETVPR